jgi:hypothetical protein
MPTAFFQIRIGDPICHDRLSVFPLFADTLPAVEYILGAEGFADGTVVVEEVSKAGTVAKLSVTARPTFWRSSLKGSS